MNNMFRTATLARISHQYLHFLSCHDNAFHSWIQ